MIKIVNMLVREDDYTHEEFVDYWLNDHADLAEQLPGLRKYVTSTPTDPEKSEYDGVLELYFDDVAALGSAFESEVGREVQADAESFIKMDEGPQVIVEETVQLDETR